MNLLVWLVIFIAVLIVLGTIILMSAHLKEDRVWRWLFSMLFTVVQLLVFGGAYFAGKQGWWWMVILFALVSFFTFYSILIPDD